jgi:hypothetical protein
VRGIPFDKGHKKIGGRVKGTKNKPKTFAENLVDVHDGMSREEVLALDKRALELAMGQTIVTESQDGQQITAKVVSDPRLLIAIMYEVRKEREGKSQAPIQSLPILDGLRKELEGYGTRGDDTATA